MKSLLVGLFLSLIISGCKTAPKNAYNVETVCSVLTVINNQLARLYYIKTELNDHVRVSGEIYILGDSYSSTRQYDIDSEEAKTGKIIVKTDNYFFIIFTATSTPDKNDFTFEADGPTVRGLESFKTKETECKLTK